MNQYPLNNIKPEVLKKIAQGVLNTYQLDSLKEINIIKALENEMVDLEALNEGNDAQSLAAVRVRRALDESVTDEMLMPTVFEYNDGLLILARVCRNDADETLIEVFSDQVLNIEILKKVMPSIITAFSWCTAKYISVWAKPNSSAEKELLALPGSLGCDSFIAADKHQVLLETDSQLSIRAFNLENDWPWYENEYNAFLKENPHMKHIVPISEKDEIEEAVDNNLCACALLGSTVIGMVMAEASQELGYKGLLFSDIFITGAFRGKGLASPMQRLFIKEKLAEFELFSGFIDKNNLASIKNAAKQGRQLLRQEICLPTQLLV
ncbi:hypothetical protein [Pseudoalteromonas denitrificans]|uniref:N-acetyltransferase domain-containing protein n=1 Tax=Pseudoalteromonas denitrificans DSM 6059 TaxID=1123010 RepID=A0A1I1KC00_9GAMM|nr:hypothetical protein [Pseudoalteromonas denitrificans]SFC58417.1 hypothetical protein SAMN02745724_02031 [Pseudoalteromonas denitrificans DSM 6059]